MYALASQSSGGSWVLLILVYAVIFAGFWFYFYQTTEKRAEKSSGYDLRNGSGRYRADDQRILRCYH